MDREQIDTFRQMLTSLRDETEQLINAAQEASDTVPLDQSKVGRLSRMDALQAQQMAQETARRRQLQLQKIDSALRRMDAGDYGYCHLCGDEISAARLNFDPANTRCIACADH
jgi:DnaK suppressor protein